MNNNVMLIIRREYLERVSKKTFIVTTILMPVILLALCFVPALVMVMQTPSAKRIAVIDESGMMLPMLQSSEAVDLAPTDLPLDSITSDYDSHYDYDGVLYIGKDFMTNNSDVRLYMHDAVPIELENSLVDQLGNNVEEIRMRDYNIHNLNEILDAVKSDVSMQTYRIDEGETTSSSSAVAIFIGIAMSFILYMMILMYGNMVMTSIIEEKSNRVLELVVSSVKPMQLMIGKIVGIGLVAVTQIAIWAALIGSALTFVLPAVLSPELTSEVASMQAGTYDAATGNYDPEMLQAMMSLLNVGYILQIFGYLILFMCGGFLLYAAMYAAIASSVDNIQDASQLSYIPTLPIVISMVLMMTVAQDPNSSLSVWLSMIPFTSPMIMMTRIPFGIPWWEVVASLVILYASFMVMVWFSGKIYRVGIFMHGKKPTVKDLIRWARYK